MNPLGRKAWRILGTACATVLVGVLTMAHFTDRLIFAPPPSSYGGQTEGLVRLPTATGDTVAGLLATTAGAPLTVVFTHGNAEDIGDLRDLVATYRGLGVSVLAVEYPGYGLSTGRPSEAGAYAAGDAALAYLTDHGVPPGRVVISSTTTASEWGSSSRKRARYFSRMISAATSSSGWSETMPGGK